MRWFPWKWLLRRASRRFGVLDPVTLLARVRQFAEPSEVYEPLEIVRAWVIFHARGVVNTRAIQHNLDWLWPYWIQRQFDPQDTSFIPRSYSVSHVNMTHRNWTAVGLPDLPLYPLVDPRGLVTPLYDGWSLAFWLVDDQGQQLVPSRLLDDGVQQHWHLADPLTVASHFQRDGLELSSRVAVEAASSEADHQPVLRVNLEGQSPRGGYLVVGLRPYNCEGIQFIDRVEVADNGRTWRVNGTDEVRFGEPAQEHHLGHYDEDDAFNSIQQTNGHNAIRDHVHCRVGMATAVALFPLQEGATGGFAKGIDIRVPLGEELKRLDQEGRVGPGPRASSWDEFDRHLPALELPEATYVDLYRAACRTLLLLSPHEVYPGPYVYRRFWYRDACLMLNALLSINHGERCWRIVEQAFPKRQRASGYFESQEGEWDSNGQVLWLCERLWSHTGIAPSASFAERLRRAARWLDGKRMGPKGVYPGLLPAGFSAEHLGPNNYYYWDNFWAAGGLLAAERLFRAQGFPEDAQRAAAVSAAYLEAVENTLAAIPEERRRGALPAAPNRRMDAGAVGSLVVDYPLRLWSPGETRVLNTVNFLMDYCRVGGGFFQDMTHSGINAYLTLHLAQVLLRAGQPRFEELVDTVAGLATTTGQWPEAIHPHTKGGCMGDGQHGWAAAEWALIIQALFVRQEGDGLVVGSGLLPRWLSSDAPLRFGPTPTPWGPVTVAIEGPAASRTLQVEGQWRDGAPVVRAAVPGFEPFVVTPGAGPHVLRRTPP